MGQQHVQQAKPACSCCPCPAGADASRSHGRMKADAQENYPDCPQTPCVHGPPVLYGHANPLLLQTRCEALLSSSTLLLPGSMHPGRQLLLTGPCRHSPATVHSSHQPLGGCLPHQLPRPAHNSLHLCPQRGQQSAGRSCQKLTPQAAALKGKALPGAILELCERVNLRAWVWQQGLLCPAAATSDMGSGLGWARRLQL